MAVHPRLNRWLADHRAQFEVIPHTEAFTAREVAMTSHVPGHTMAKVIVVRETRAVEYAK